uniref:Uncharacterized protein n=1 Tax=Tetranychus urticae TaxID=32264 RepID=T1KQE0_TETUR
MLCHIELTWCLSIYGRKATKLWINVPLPMVTPISMRVAKSPVRLERLNQS